MDNLTKSVADDLDKELGAATMLKATMPKAVTPALSMAERLFAMADGLKELHRDIDALEAEFMLRLNELRKRIGTK